MTTFINLNQEIILIFTRQSDTRKNFINFYYKKMGYKLINGEAISVVYFEKLKFFIKNILRLVRVKNSDVRKKEAMTLCR